MFDSISCVPMRRKPLAGCLAAILCLTVPVSAVAATTWTVNACDETNVGSGATGTLRYAAANAVSGDTIDMTGLACSTITLSSGAVVLPQADVTLTGPGKDALTIESGNDRVFRHDGRGGTLAVKNLTVANGYLHPSAGASADGGCIARTERSCWITPPCARVARVRSVRLRAAAAFMP